MSKISNLFLEKKSKISQMSTEKITLLHLLVLIIKKEKLLNHKEIRQAQ